MLSVAAGKTRKEERMSPKTHTTMNAKDAAKYLGVSRFSLSKLVRQGKLTGYKTPGGQARYSIRELNRLRLK